MATSNTFGWISPDPYAGTPDYITKISLIGQIQHYYKNHLRPRWKHTDTDTPTGWSFDYHKVDPSGENIVFGDQKIITRYVAPLPTTSGIHVSGFVSVVQSGGGHLSGADAAWIGNYCTQLKDTREFIEGLYGQKWSWIAPSSISSHYNLSIAEHTTDGVRYYDEAPHMDYIQFLREVPDVGPYEFVGSTADYSEFNSDNVGDFTVIGGTQIFEGVGWKPTSPAVAPHLAREQFGQANWSLLNGSVSDPDFSIISGDNNNGIGKVGMNGKSSGPGLDINSSNPIQFTWLGELLLPLYKRTASTLPATQGLLLYSQNQGNNGSKGVIRNGPVINSDTKVRFKVTSGGMPTITPSASADNVTYTTNRDWFLEINVRFWVGGSYDTASLSYAFEEERIIVYSGGSIISDDTTTESLPVGKFSAFSFDGTITIIDDFPDFLNYTIEEIRFTTGCFARSNNQGAADYILQSHSITGLDVIPT